MHVEILHRFDPNFIPVLRVCPSSLKSGLTMKRILLPFVFTSCVACLFSFKQLFDLKASIQRGKSVYEGYCSSCHMSEGEGLEGVFPPLTKSPHLNSKEKLVKIIRNGMRGKIVLAGKEYNGEMAGIPLSDQETSDVINYIRNSFGNKGPAVQPQEIQAALKATVKDYQPY